MSGNQPPSGASIDATGVTLDVARARAPAARILVSPATREVTAGDTVRFTAEGIDLRGLRTVASVDVAQAAGIDFWKTGPAAAH